MTVTAISRIHYVCKQQSSVKGLKFGYRQNLIDNTISTGVTEDDVTHDSLHNMPNYEATSTAIQHDVLVDDDKISEHHKDGVDDITEEVTEDNNNESSDEDSGDNDEDNDGGNEDGVAVENRADEVVVVEENTAQLIEQGFTSRSGRLSKPCNHATNFLETAHVQSGCVK